jgi:hypothetical protein
MPTGKKPPVFTAAPDDEADEFAAFRDPPWAPSPAPSRAAIEAAHASPDACRAAASRFLSAAERCRAEGFHPKYAAAEMAAAAAWLHKAGEATAEDVDAAYAAAEAAAVRDR